MKRSVIVGVTALVAGLLLAITAFSAPFRAYDRAAADQYTTPPPACTNTSGNAPENNPNCTATTPPRPGCENPNAAANNPNCQTAAQSAPTTPAAEVKSEETGDGTPSDVKAGTAPDEAEGVGSAPARVRRNATGGPGVSGGAGRAADRSNIAYLFVGEQPAGLASTLITITGAPVWAAVVRDLDANALATFVTGTTFAGLATDDLAGIRRLGRRVGADSVPATGLSPRLPNLVDAFDGAIRPITGLVLARTKIEDTDDRRAAEAFQRAFAAGALRADIPVVGVELNRSSPSSIAYFKTIKGASSVDDIGTRRGAVSLTRLLAGATPGHFGRQDSARAATPPTIDARATSSPLQDGGSSLGGSPLLVGLLLTIALLGGRALVSVVQRTRAAR